MNYYDLDGNPIDMETWATRFEDVDGRRIGLDERGDVRISTVWLGLDHQWGDGPPLIFETMVFGGEHDGEMRRYSTREQAERGHEAMVRSVLP